MGVRGTYAKRLAFVYAASVVCLLLAAQRVGGVPIDDFLLFTLGGASNAADARVPALIFGALPLLIPGFSLAYSCTYLVVLIAIEALVGLAFIKRMDLM